MFHPRIFARELGLHHAARSRDVMVGGILLFVGGLLTAISLVAWSTEQRYRRDGRTAEARVIAIAPPSHGVTVVHLRYRDAGAGVEVDAHLDFTRRQPLPAGPTMAMEYIPGDLLSARRPSRNPAFVLVLALAVCLPLAAGGAYVLARGLREVARARRLERAGPP
jgi:hypothetical protein